MMLHQDQLPQDSYVLENGLKEWKRVLTDLTDPVCLPSFNLSETVDDLTSKTRL